MYIWCDGSTLTYEMTLLLVTAPRYTREKYINYNILDIKISYFTWKVNVLFCMDDFSRILLLGGIGTSLVCSFFIDCVSEIVYRA